MEEPCLHLCHSLKMWVVHIARSCWLKQVELKVKVTFLGGAFRWAGHLGDHIFHAPWSQALSLCHWACIISVTYPLCGLALTNIMDNLYEMCPPKLTGFCGFCTINHTQPYKGRYSPNGFYKLLWPGLKSATPRWESQHSNHAVAPT